MSDKMLCFSEIAWSEVMSSDERPVNFFLSGNLPVYIKVNRDRHLVYIHLHRWTEIRKTLKFERTEDFSLSRSIWKEDWRILPAFPCKGFDEDLVFLRLGHKTLVDIAVSGSSRVESFSGDGFWSYRPSELVGHEIRNRREIRIYEDIRNPILNNIEFSHAFLVDKKEWELARSRLVSWPDDDLEKCRISIKVRERNLYFNPSDIEALKQGALDGCELVHYPYEHRERMPGIYWMFQAAYALNELKIIKTDKEIEDDLKKKAPKETYRYKTLRTARKFIRLILDRAKGARGEGDFNLEDLDNWTVREDYEFTYVSKGLSFILAIADWWVRTTERDPNEAKLTLVEKLAECKFGGLEIGDLVYLISGSQITEEDNTSFEAYLKDSKKQVRRAIDRKPGKSSSYD